MKLYNQNTNRIENIKTILTPGIKYTNKLTKEELNNLGYYLLKYESKPNKRYYNYETKTEIQEGYYVTSYTPVNKPIDEVKTLMQKELKKAFLEYAKRPQVDTSLGYSVQAGRNDLENFGIGKEFGIDAVRDINNEMHLVTQEDYNTIILAIKQKGILLYQTKWSKELEINEFETIQDCILYEATPYEVQEEITNEMGEPTGETHIVTRYKNNTKEW